METTNQRNRLLELLRAKQPHWVPLQDVLEVAGFQYGARNLELRRLGHRIENDPGRAFRLVIKQREAQQSLAETAAGPCPLFPELTGVHRDNG